MGGVGGGREQSKSVRCLAATQVGLHVGSILLQGRSQQPLTSTCAQGRNSLVAPATCPVGCPSAIPLGWNQKDAVTPSWAGGSKAWLHFTSFQVVSSPGTGERDNSLVPYLIQRFDG